MAKRRITRASKLRLTFLGPVSIFIIIYSIFTILYNGYNIYSLTIEKNKLENKYIELKDKAEELKTDIEKLNDQEYIANYAREKYLYSKDGEYIIQLDEDLDNANDDMNEVDKLIKSLSKNINNNYIILFLSFIMILIFVYIIRKGKKK